MNARLIPLLLTALLGSALLGREATPPANAPATDPDAQTGPASTTTTAPTTASAPAPDEDWDQFLGPNRNGVSDGPPLGWG